MSLFEFYGDPDSGTWAEIGYRPFPLGDPVAAPGVAGPTNDEGVTAGTTTVDAERIKRLEQENRELRRTNAILKSGGCGTNVDRPARDSRWAGESVVWPTTSCRLIVSS
jgi:hypothetical protein